MNQQAQAQEPLLYESRQIIWPMYHFSCIKRIQNIFFYQNPFCHALHKTQRSPRSCPQQYRRRPGGGARSFVVASEASRDAFSGRGTTALGRRSGCSTYALGLEECACRWRKWRNAEQMARDSWRREGVGGGVAVQGVPVAVQDPLPVATEASRDAVRVRGRRQRRSGSGIQRRRNAVGARGRPQRRSEGVVGGVS